MEDDFDEAVQTLVDEDWEDDDLEAGGDWNVRRFLEWFADVAGVEVPAVTDGVRRFLADQCTSLLRVCDDEVMAAYLGTLGTKKPEVLSYLAFLNDPGRYGA